MNLIVRKSYMLFLHGISDEVKKNQKGKLLYFNEFFHTVFLVYVVVIIPVTLPVCKRWCIFSMAKEQSGSKDLEGRIL